MPQRLLKIPSILPASILFVPLLAVSCASPRAAPSSQANGVSEPATKPVNPATKAVRPQAGGSGQREVYEEGDFVLNDVPLESALSQLSDGTSGYSRVRQMQVDWDALASIGITRTSKVTIKLWSPTVGKALKAILESARHESRSEPTFFDEGNSCIRVTTRDLHLSRDGLVREYNLRSLFFGVPDEPAPSERRTSLFDTTHNGGPMTRDERKDAIEALVKESVDSDSWSRVKSCSIHFMNDILVIRQVEENHRAIEILLEQLGETRSTDVLNSRVRPTTFPTTTRIER